MDLGGWLRSLGLERYETAFRENEIDETVLPSLTHETLKEIGATAVGHRLKLLAAIACCIVADVSAAVLISPPHDGDEQRNVLDEQAATHDRGAPPERC
jgi:hypothetical protein